MAEESELQRKILRDLESYDDVECFKIMKANKNAIPDIFFTSCVTKGVLIEAKRLKGKARANQEKKIYRLNKCGTLALICDSWDQWMEIKRNLGFTKLPLLSQ